MDYITPFLFFPLCFVLSFKGKKKKNKAEWSFERLNISRTFLNTQLGSYMKWLFLPKWSLLFDVIFIYIFNLIESVCVLVGVCLLMHTGEMAHSTKLATSMRPWVSSLAPTCVQLCTAVCSCNPSAGREKQEAPNTSPGSPLLNHWVPGSVKNTVAKTQVEKPTDESVVQTACHRSLMSCVLCLESRVEGRNWLSKVVLWLPCASISCTHACTCRIATH